MTIYDTNLEISCCNCYTVVLDVFKWNWYLPFRFKRSTHVFGVNPNCVEKTPLVFETEHAVSLISQYDAG